MGILDIFRKNKNNNKKVAFYLDGRYPWYSQFGKDIFLSDVVKQAIMSIVNELVKLDMVHVRKNNNGEYIGVNGDIQRVLDNPNPLMTSVDYKSKVFTNLLLNENAFVYPMYENGKLKSLWPLQPVYVEWRKDPTNNLWIYMKFGNGYECELPYENIIHLRKDFSVSEYMGGNEDGKADNKALLETLEINNVLLKGLTKSLKMQCSVNAAIKMKTMANIEAQKQEITNFEKKLENNESGILPLDIQTEFVPINKQIQLLDATTLEFIDKKILRTFGVSIAIVDRDYTAAQYEAFYQSTLEPIVKIAVEAHTKGLFSARENGFGNKIMFYTKELIFMNTQQKIAYFDILVDSGACYKNELRTAFGLRPLQELEGQIAESSNKTNAENNKENNKTNSNPGGVYNE